MLQTVREGLRLVAPVLGVGLFTFAAGARHVRRTPALRRFAVAAASRCW